MAHPTQAFPKQFAIINAAETVTADIFAIQVITAASETVDVKALGFLSSLQITGLTETRTLQTQIPQMMSGLETISTQRILLVFTKDEAT